MHFPIPLLALSLLLFPISTLAVPPTAPFDSNSARFQNRYYARALPASAQTQNYYYARALPQKQHLYARSSPHLPLHKRTPHCGPSDKTPAGDKANCVKACEKYIWLLELPDAGQPFMQFRLKRGKKAVATIEGCGALDEFVAEQENGWARRGKGVN